MQTGVWLYEQEASGVRMRERRRGGGGGNDGSYHKISINQFTHQKIDCAEPLHGPDLDARGVFAAFNEGHVL